MKQMKTSTKVCIGVAAVGSLLLVIDLISDGCGSLFRREPGAYLSSGRWVAGEKLKTPLAASARVFQRGQVAVFSLRLRDAAGAEISRLVLPTGEPRPPKVEIFDAEGQRVYACTLEYG